ncbi:MAG: hypothetical protein ACREBC_19525 [Pyrinomonadaceae bacterium]
MPIAAVDESAIQRYIGKIATILAPGMPNKALLVQPREIATINKRLPIWGLPESAILHQPNQVWVHVAYSGYRKAYIKAFADEDFDSRVLDHVLNRRVARLKGFQYVRIVPISRGANSSSGTMSEVYGVEYHSSPEMVEKNRAGPTFIQYADIADIVKMLDIQTGGTLQDGVNEALRLVEEV